LGERLDRTQEVSGSNPLSSIAWLGRSRELDEAEASADDTLVTR